MHAGRQLRLGPIAFWVVVGTTVIMAVWTVTTATYFAFREDVLTGLIARHAEMQYAYEDRIADLRAQIDRISSRQLLNQEQYEQKLEQIMRRQATLEGRARTLQSMPDDILTGTAGRREGRASSGPSAIHDKSSRLVAPKRSTREAMGATLARLQTSLDRVEARQEATLSSMQESYDTKARRIRGVLADLGVDTARLSARADIATGGPLVAARPPADAGEFERHIQRVGIARAHLDRLEHTLGLVPLRRPVMGEIEVGSGFGVRIDPFIRAPAMHTGVDLRADAGDPVRSTAEGTVTVAGWNGGYGKMVEIDHGNGLATRYGHMSAIDVRVGQHVRVGQILGKVGSTGRSTGPHLHYETRVNGEAVDPQKFLRAGTRLTGIQ
jgi:murein DD-endopeptidase MepM/ murein hydrolase activator NlpD